MTYNKLYNKINFVFFGTSDFSVKILGRLIKNGFIPDIVVTIPDKQQGRKMVITPSPVKVFGKKYDLKIIQPEKLTTSDLDIQCPSGFDLFIVASYGKIIPKSVLEIPKYGTLNVHPSILPKFRGPSPIQSFILSDENKTGVTIMLMDEQVDHGQILAQRHLEVSPPSPLGGETSKWLNSKQLEEKLVELGGQMLVDAIPKWINREIKPIEQNHNQATFTKKIFKEDGLVDLEKDNPEIIYRKFLAFYPWPGIYFFVEKEDKKIRVIIIEMKVKDKEVKIISVKPEGKKEMSYDDFLRGYKVNN